MQYLDQQALNAADHRAFQNAHPYPWSGLSQLIHPDKYGELVDTLPDSSLFTERFGKKRKFGQRSHDRLSLEYEPSLPLSAPWKTFIEELKSPDYIDFVKRMAGTSLLDLHFHWHYTPNGCSVSPHCDANRKIGSHIFYFNTEDDWDPAWGGDTLILDDEGKFSRRSNPEFKDFMSSQRAKALGNNSLLFIRNGNSWHGVEEIKCPEGKYRKVFIVVINKVSVSKVVRKYLSV